MKKNRPSENGDEKKKDILTEVQPWEQKMGATTLERVQLLGRESKEYRESVHFAPVDKDTKHRHEVYIHHLGSDVLRAMFTDEQIYAKEREIALKKQSKVGQLLKKRIKVTDFDDGGLNISMEQDWDTSTWNDTLIEAAAEALVFVFYDLSGVSSQERKERAIQMLKKLMERHSAAEAYIRRNLEMLMGKAASKLIRKGVSGGIPNLLYVINSCKEKFYLELSNYNFTGRVIEMLILETRLAAILIQHTYRARFSKRKLKESTKKLPHLEGFGTEKEVYYRQLRVINARSSELRYYWRLMHNHHPKKLCLTVGGLRGPIHIGEQYLLISLEILRFLVSDNVKTYAHGNREDIVRANGCILLSTYIGTPNNKFAPYAVQIVAEIAKVAESFYPIVESGCVSSTIKYMKYLRSIYGVGVKVVKPRKNDSISLVQAYLSGLDVIANTALHASGVSRAKDGYQFIRSAAKGIERTDYRMILSTMQIKNGVSIDDLVHLLCTPLVLSELSNIILTAQQPSILTKAVFCVLVLLSSNGHHLTLHEILSVGGKLLIKLLELLIVDDANLATMSLCIFHQISCYESSRKSLSIINVPGFILPLFQKVIDEQPAQRLLYGQTAADIDTTGAIINNIKITRLLLVIIFLSRQKNWKLYDPELLFEEYLNGGLPYMRQMIYLNLLRTIKNQCFNGNEKNSVLTCPDLLLLPTVNSLAISMSKTLFYYPVHYLMQFLYHPNDPLYYESCPLDEVCTIATIIYSFSFYKPLLKSIIKKELILFLCKFLFLIKYIFLNKKLMNKQIIVLFHGVKAGILILSEFIPIILKDIPLLVNYLLVLKETELIDQSIFFYLNTLQEFEINKFLFNDDTYNENEKEKLFYTLQLQKEIGLCSIRFLTNYAKLVNVCAVSQTISLELMKYHTKNSLPILISIQDLTLIGKRVVFVLKNLKKLYQTEMINENNQKASGSRTSSRAQSRRGSSSTTTTPGRRRHDDEDKPSLKETFEYYNSIADLQSFYSNQNITFQFPSYRDEMTFIFDCLCVCLTEMTKLSGGAVTALQEWEIQPALRINLPPPLSSFLFSSKSNQIADPTKQEMKSTRTQEPSTAVGNGNNQIVRIASSASNGMIHQSDTNSVNKPVQSPHHQHKSVSNNQKAFSEILVQDENLTNYRLELMEIPSSFFEVVANLCNLAEGKIFCLIDGFIRRALDKLTLLHSLLPTNDTHEMSIQSTSNDFIYPFDSTKTRSSFFVHSLASPKRKKIENSYSSEFIANNAIVIPLSQQLLSPNQKKTFKKTGELNGPSEELGEDEYYHQLINYSQNFQQQQLLNSKWDAIFSWTNKKKDLISCLKVIRNAANFHHKDHGSTNELMLNPNLYSLVNICKDIIKLHVQRDEELIILAYEALAELSKDTFHFHKFMEETHLLEVIKQELSVSIDFPIPGIIAALSIIQNGCQGIASGYIVTMIPLLREPLIRVARIYPQLNEQVRNANWILTKSAMIYKSTVDPNYEVAYNQHTVEMEEYFRTGNKEKFSEASTPAKPNDEEKNTPAHLEEGKDKGTLETKIENAVNEGNLDQLQQHHHHHHHDGPLTLDKLGDYTYCGVGSCGSLRFPDAPEKHGKYQEYSEKEAEEMIKKLPLLEVTRNSQGKDKKVMPLTKLPVNDKYLAETLQSHKGKEGFTEIKKFNPYQSKDELSSSDHSNNNLHRRSLSAPRSLASMDSFASPSKGKSSSSKILSSSLLSSPAALEHAQKGIFSPIRSIAVSELPELKLTRPKLPKKE